MGELALVPEVAVAGPHEVLAHADHFPGLRHSDHWQLRRLLLLLLLLLQMLWGVLLLLLQLCWKLWSLLLWRVGRRLARSCLLLLLLPLVLLLLIGCLRRGPTLVQSRWPGRSLLGLRRINLAAIHR